MNEMMVREIAAQAEILPACVQPLASRIASIAAPKGRVFAGGCGDSAFAPAALGGVFDALGTNVIACTAMTLAGFTRFVPTDTVILSSISGGTRRTLEAAHVARGQGARVIALTCNGASNLAQEATETILLPFSPLSRKTPHTLDYGVTLLALTQLELAWSGAPADAVHPVLDVLSQLLAAARQTAETIASGMLPNGGLFILGAGPELASAEYGAAKFHEAGGLAAVAAETENFIHGQNFMVEPQDTILALGGNEPGLRRGREITDEFRDFVAQVAVVTPETFDGGGWQQALADLLSTTFVLQHLCLAIADRNGLAVDEPRAGRENGLVHLEMQSKIMAR